MSQIHPMSVIDSTARIGRDVTVGPFCHVGPHVELGDGCVLQSNVTLLGPATVGRGNIFYPNCTIGADPQDLKFKGGTTRVIIGDDNRFRENVTVHRGTEVDRHSDGTTRIGSHNLFMVGVHVAHDCDIANHCILANHVLLAGHVKLEDCVNVGGSTAMHHFVTVGRYAYVGGMTRVTHDAPPYMKIEGYDQRVRAPNSKGMQRWHIDDASVQAVKQAFRLLYARRGEHSPGRTVDAMREIEGNGLIGDPHVRYLVDFLKLKMSIGIFGRQREHFRSDSDADRAGFYGAGEAKPTA